MWQQLSPRSFQFPRRKRKNSLETKKCKYPLTQSTSMRELPTKCGIDKSKDYALDLSNVTSTTVKSISFEEEPDPPSEIALTQHTLLSVEDFISISVSSTCEVEIEVYKVSEDTTKLVLICNKPVELDVTDML